MTQPPSGHLAVQPGHPRPDPIPEPEPPQPIPPPEPPRSSIAAAEGADFLTAEPPTTWLGRPPAGSYPSEPGEPPTTSFESYLGEPATTRLESYLGEPATTRLEWPPVGAYPGEPGYGRPPGDQPTATIPAFDAPTVPLDDQTQTIGSGWHQPPPTEPWHARHERPGEWQYPPPEHLAFTHSPPAEVQPGVQDQPRVPDRPTQVAHPLWEVPLLPMNHEAPKRNRPGVWVSMALVITLLLFAGGATSAYLLLRNSDSGRGAPDPATAVNRFMTAVYTQQDATAADDMVCREARDKGKLSGRVDQIKTYAAEYAGPAFRWSDPAVSSQSDDSATVAVQLTMSTDDEKQAQQELTFTVVHKTGWLVCDIAG